MSRQRKAWINARYMAVLVCTLPSVVWAQQGGDLTDEGKAQLVEMCSDLGAHMGESIGNARSSGANQSQAAAAAVVAYAQARGEDVRETQATYLPPALEFAREIFKLENRQPETMSVYAFNVCLINTIFQKDMPSDAAGVQRINQILAGCEETGAGAEELTGCILGALQSLIDSFPERR